MEIMATSKNYGKKKGSDHFRDILNPYGEKPNYGKIGRRMMMIHDDDDRQSLRLFSHIRPHPQILIQ